MGERFPLPEAMSRRDGEPRWTTAGGAIAGVRFRLVGYRGSLPRRLSATRRRDGISLPCPLTAARSIAPRVDVAVARDDFGRVDLDNR